MTELNAGQTDALSELINIAFGLTASKLSEISGQRVLLEAPAVLVHPVDYLLRKLELFVTGEAVSVHQVFTGSLSGDAILFLNRGSAVNLSNLFVDVHLRSERMDAAKGEILTEVGNMLLSACLGMFGNLMEARIVFSVPLLHVDSRESLLDSISILGNELRQAVVIATSFRIREHDVVGQIAVVLAASSLDRLIQGVKVWQGNQFSA